MAISSDELEQTTHNFDRMISMLGLVAEINAQSESEIIHLSVKTEDPGRLIGRNGQTLNALQHLLNGILLNKKKNFPKVLIDVEGYQDKRSTAARRPKPQSNQMRTRRRAIDAAKEVKRWGEKVTLQGLKKSEISAVVEALKDEKELEVVSGYAKKDGTQEVIIQLRKP